MRRKEDRFPYQSLGKRLKYMRETSKESLAEVSGAVEIEVETLTKYEQGSERPSEDILMLLSSHFGLKDDEATRLWELASYDKQLENENTNPAVMVSQPDAKIAYTDMVHVTVNNYGVVLNFMQGNGPNGQPMIVSRVGMSKEHARSVLEVMQKTMTMDTQKSLPAPESPEDKQRKN